HRPDRRHLRTRCLRQRQPPRDLGHRCDPCLHGQGVRRRPRHDGRPRGHRPLRRHHRPCPLRRHLRQDHPARRSGHDQLLQHPRRQDRQPGRDQQPDLPVLSRPASTRREGRRQMPSQVDPQVAAALAAAEGSAGIPAPAPGDWKALRARANAGQAYLASLIAPSANVTISTCTAAATDGTPGGLRWYARRGPAPGSAVVYAHGGGMVARDLDAYDSLVSLYVSMTGVPFLSVDYRLAPDATGETLAGDVFAGVTWLSSHAGELGTDP